MTNQALAYSRVSTVEQALSLTAQETAILNYCRFKDLDLLAIFSDVGVSGGLPLAQRPRGNALLSTLRPGMHLVVHKLDRAWRKARDCLTTCSELEERGVQLHIVTMGIDLSGAMGKCFLTMAAAFAELERDMISQRTKEGLAASSKRIGQPPYGYNRDLSPRPREIEALETIAHFKSKLSPQEIAHVLNDRGLPTRNGRPWNQDLVKWRLRKLPKEKN